MRTPATNEIINAMKEWMRVHKLTLHEAAKILKCSHMAVQKLLTGESKSIRAKLMIALEPHINRYRDPVAIQQEFKKSTNGMTKEDYKLCNFNAEVLDFIKSYKEEKGYSFDELGKKFKIPISKLASWYEIKCTDKTFTIAPEDFSIFAAFLSQLFSEVSSEKKADS